MKLSSSQLTRSSAAAFTFIELVIVIAVIGVMSALAIGQFSNSANDAREITARQQQGAIQTAVSAWVNGQSDGTTTIGELQTTYNAATTSAARLEIFKDYLDDPTYTHITEQMGIVGTNEIMTDATRKLSWHINLPNWADDSYPKVELVKSSAPTT